MIAYHLPIYTTYLEDAPSEVDAGSSETTFSPTQSRRKVSRLDDDDPLPPIPAKQRSTSIYNIYTSNSFSVINIEDEGEVGTHERKERGRKP